MYNKFEFRSREEVVAKEVKAVNGSFVSKNKTVKTERMVAINNKNNMLIIISND
ncbi:hypothetical protein [Psychrobacillus lasiicapitis]|uniref:hypothetical protein n=1 Tax=Psychrobacillus lasiicapitis TaxID=1636719 RepID=UPI001B8812C1|nr:hypothetical protein [Psychrobacillus lasiicapitis]